MAHSCPICFLCCHCGGDIDDIDFGDATHYADMCTCCDEDEDEYEDYDPRCDHEEEEYE